MNIKDYFSEEQKQAMVRAVQLAEKDSSAEIRIHFENHCKEDVVERAAKIFTKLEMDKTAMRNGVLIYVAVKDHKVAVLGDIGINEKVADNFWDSVYWLMIDSFRKGELCEGICAAVEKVGEQLKHFFPYQVDDVNELPDDISYGK